MPSINLNTTLLVRPINAPCYALEKAGNIVYRRTVYVVGRSLIYLCHISHLADRRPVPDCAAIKHRAFGGSILLFS